MHFNQILITLFSLLLISAAPSKSKPSSPPLGHQTLTFPEKNPLSAIPELTRRTDLTLHETESMIRDYDASELEHIQLSWRYDLDKQPFDIVVPASDTPTSRPGLLVWLGPPELPDTFLPILARHNLILISAPGSTDRVSVVREAIALDAVHNMQKLYKLDDTRIYIAGFSSGAQLATWLLRAYPDVFSGGYFLMGGWFYDRFPSSLRYFGGKDDPDHPPYPSAFTLDPIWKGNLQKIKRDAKIVLMRGEKDETFARNLQDGPIQLQGLQLDGFQRATYLEVPNAQHELPDPTWFEKGVAALEAAPKAAPTTAPTKDPNPTPDQIAQAYRLLATAPHNGSKMRGYAEKVLKDYPTTPAAEDAQKMLDWLDRDEKKPRKR
jgi:pimeloyl-ACP methyl ester carboxylesterase